MDEFMTMKPIDDIKFMSNEDIDELFSRLSAEKERRKKNRCYELIEAVCKSVNALHKEFPYVELCVPFYCSDCAREEDFDVLDHFHGTLTCNDFNYW